MFTVSASDLRQWQTCPRRWLLERQWRVLRWRPASLFRSCLREGVFRLSNTEPIEVVRSDARTRFLSEAARPGLDMLTGDPWTVAQDWAGMLGVTLTAIARLTLLTLTRPPRVLPGTTPTTASWLPQSWADDSGTLHRWITADAFDADTLAREAHSWAVIGDMVMLDAPMMLHVVDIGQQRSGRRVSPWARCWKHPCIAGQYRFQRPDGKGGWRKLSGDKWTPLWYADQTKPDADAWCDLLDADHVTPSLLHHVTIAQPSQAQGSRIRSEILLLVEEMRRRLVDADAAVDPLSVPMARSACDPVGGPCAWQPVCMPCDSRVDIAGLGLYQIRAAGADARQATPTPQSAYTIAATEDATVGA
jgi:hypothetical protein